jgi:hypothetical protein
LISNRTIIKLNETSCIFMRLTYVCVEDLDWYGPMTLPPFIPALSPFIPALSHMESFDLLATLNPLICATLSL